MKRSAPEKNNDLPSDSDEDSDVEESHQKLLADVEGIVKKSKLVQLLFSNISPQQQWMNYRYRFGLSVISYTASGNNYLER